jgi:ssDNA-binding Zn-finger/Zn-ribbon topoisomerase 1
MSADDREPDRPPQAYRVSCDDCGFESETFQNSETAHRTAASHEHRAHDGGALVRVEGVDYVADGGEVENGVTCEECGEETFAFERYCHRCGADRWADASPFVTDGGTEGVGVDCQDCPYQDIWYPAEGRRVVKHDLVHDDHHVVYGKPTDIDRIVTADGEEIRRTDEQAELVTDGGTLTCCPRCESANIRCNAGSVASGGNEAAAAWGCSNCSHEFDEPVERERDESSNGGHCRHGVAKDLIDADPEDLVTDGGRETVAVCPECGAHDFSPRVGSMRNAASKYRYGCSRCGAEFDEPDRREREGSSPPLPESQQALLEADADDIVTDGGVKSERPAFIKPNVDTVRCHFCDRTWDPTVVEGFDLSGEDEYYPVMVPVCPAHAGGCR